MTKSSQEVFYEKAVGGGAEILDVEFTDQKVLTVRVVAYVSVHALYRGWQSMTLQ